MPRPHIQVILGDPAIPQHLREAVRRTGASASFCPLTEVVRAGLAPAADAVVVVVPDDPQRMQGLTHSLHVLFDRLADQPRAALLLKAGGGPVPRLTHPPTVPVTFGCVSSPDELAARLATMLEMRASLDSLHQGMVANRRSEERAAQRYLNQLRLASQVQREFLPEMLPRMGNVSFSAVFRPADYVSGDMYDVHRLDENHIALALADATGHGIPAALLTVFIKRALRGKEIEDGRYRILGPDEVLSRLNEDLLEASLSDCPFVAATYAVLDTATLRLSLARGGSPYPILRRRGGTLALLRPAGGVVGISPNPHFAVETVQLEPGDALLICSDGVERIVLPPLPAHGLAEVFTRAASFARVPRAAGTRNATAVAQPAPPDSDGWRAAQPDEITVAVAEEPEPRTAAARLHVPRNGHRSFGLGGGSGDGRVGLAYASTLRGNSPPRGTRPAWRAPDEALASSAWCETLRVAGPQAALDQLTIRYDTLRRLGYPLDDVAAVAMQIDP